MSARVPALSHSALCLSGDFCAQEPPHRQPTASSPLRVPCVWGSGVQKSITSPVCILFLMLQVRMAGWLASHVVPYVYVTP